MLPFDDATKDIIGEFRGGAVPFQSPVSGIIANVHNQVNDVTAILNMVPGMGQQASQLTALISGGSAMTRLQNHVGSTLADLPTKMSIYKSHKNFVEQMGETGGASCPGVGEFFGSVAGAGEAVMGQAGSALDGLRDNVMGAVAGALGRPLDEIRTMGTAELQNLISSTQGGLQAVQGAVQSQVAGAIGPVLNQVNGLMAQANDMVTKELAMANNAFAELKNMAGAMSVKNLMTDPCAAAVLATNAGPSLLGKLSRG